MGDFIVIGVLFVVVAVGVFYTVRHFKGEGGCCGGGSYRPKRKKLSHVKYQRAFTVEGMHCQHCKRRVEEAVNDMAGLAARVDLKGGTLTVSYEREVPDEELAAKLARIGYAVKAR